MSDHVDFMRITLNTRFADVLSDDFSTASWALPVLNFSAQHTIKHFVESANILNSIHNVSDDSSSLAFTIANGPDYFIFVQPGFYDVYSLRDALNVQLAIWSITVSWDRVAGKMKFVHPSLQFTFIAGASTLFPLLGFTSNLNHHSTTTGGFFLRSDTVVNMTPNHCVCIHSNFNSGSILAQHQHAQGMLQTIFINVPPMASIVFRNDNTQPICNLQRNNISEISLSLTNESGKRLDFNKQHWTVCLQLNIVRYV
jgi:hypothetical protein